MMSGLKYFYLMGICCSCIAGKSNSPQAPAPAAEPIPEPDPVPSSITAPAPAPAAETIPEPDPLPSSIADVINCDTSFLGSNVSRTSWHSMATNVTTMFTQVAEAIAGLWVNDKEDNEFIVETEDINLPDGGTVSESKLRAFTFAQLKASTSNFRMAFILGEGGFGSVHKGWIRENVPSIGITRRAIAVKKLNADSKQGFRQWRTEVGFLARLSHPNIIKLIGYCKEDDNFLIVYEFMQKGSLNYHLFRKNSDKVLPWELRLKIMTGMAQGLCYLHTREKPIIYRDFKSSNVLLDESFTAKISDFGLAKWAPTPGDSCAKGRVMGTKGYIAPEYVTAGTLYVKSDVYSFGVVLVEMLTGMQAIDRSRPLQKQNLMDWVKPCLNNRLKLREIMDSRLEGKYNAKEAFVVAILANKCIGSEPNFRPSMKEVVDTLERITVRYKTNNEELLQKG